MGNTVLRELLSEIMEVSMYSMIADEASDVSHKEQLCIAIRWVDSSFQVHKTPLELINIPKTDSETLTSMIKNCLVRLALPIGGQNHHVASNHLSTHRTLPPHHVL